MPYTPENNPVKISKELEEKIRTAPSPEHIAQYMREAYVEQGLAQTDEFNPEHFTPTKRAETPQPRRFAKTLTVDGTKYTLESDSEQGLVQKEIAFYRSLQQPNTTTEVARDDQGRFTTERAQGRADENLIAKAELELKFKRGEIDTATFLAQSGAIESYLEQQGIPLDTLKEVAQERQDTRFVQSWEDATLEFLNSPEGRTWPGGPNLQVIGKIIADQNWQDEPDKVAVLTTAYRYMRENDLVVKNPEAEALRQMQEARTPEDLRDAAVAYRGGDSSIFGR
jgi:hypothetical protein